MNTIAPTDASTGFAETILYQDPPADAVGYLARVSAYYSMFSPDPLGDTAPTVENLHRAKALLLNDFLGTFALFDQTSRAHALAMTLQPLARPLISGPTPLYVVGGPQASGKTTLVEGAQSLYDSPAESAAVFGLHGSATGRNWRKEIAGGLALRPTHFWIEDGASRISSPILAQALSRTEFTFRKSGGVETVTLPVRCLWVYTSVRPVVSRDIAIRTVNILVAQNTNWYGGHPSPFYRSLCANTIQSRLFGAALTLVRAWLEAGQPRYMDKSNRYAEWSQIMGGILEVADVPGFLDD